MRQRNRLTADEWATRLNAEMERVLLAPASFPEATVWWARRHRTWLAEIGSLFHEPAERAEVAEAEGLAGPSCGPARAGGLGRTTALAAAPKIGCQWSVVAPSPPATALESTTSAHSGLSLAGDKLGARGAGNGAAEPKTWGARWAVAQETCCARNGIMVGLNCDAQR